MVSSSIIGQNRFMSDERFQQLEEKLAFLEMTNTELSEEIFRQQQEIDTLKLAHKRLHDQYRDLQDAIEQGGSQVNEKPPHY